MLQFYTSFMLTYKTIAIFFFKSMTIFFTNNYFLFILVRLVQKQRLMVKVW